MFGSYPIPNDITYDQRAKRRESRKLSTICITSSETMGEVKCENLSKHHVATENGHTRSFNADAEEFDYWERIQRPRRDNMKREYLERNECLLCIIDNSMKGKF
jgi:hypothetical protein